MQKRYQSGAQKRARKRKADEKVKNLPKIDSFLKPTPRPSSPSTSAHQVDPVEEAYNMAADEIEAVEMDLHLRDEQAQLVQIPEMVEGVTLEADSDRIKEISSWNVPMSNTERETIIVTGVDKVQNINGPFLTFSRSGENVKGTIRQLESKWFYIHLPQKENLLRTWMSYSLVSGKLYCICCRLFAKVNETSRMIIGFDHWWELNPKLQDHEGSSDHINNFNLINGAY